MTKTSNQKKDTKSLWRLKVCGEFAAAHALRNYQGKCENIHGHNFQVEAVVEGSTLSQDTEILLDFSVLKKELNLVLDILDHKDISQISPFDHINPSSENLARYIYQKLALPLATYPVTLYSVSVAERSIQSATYMEV